MIIDGKKIAEEVYSELKSKLYKLDNRPGLGIILVGNNPASLKYLSLKIKKSHELGMFSKMIHLPSSVAKSEVKKAILNMNNDERINGIIVQLPLPKKLNEIKILAEIKKNKDVEGLHPENFSRIVAGENILTVAPAAIIKIIDYYHIKLRGKRVTIINDSYLVGRPLAYLLLNRGAIVTICHKDGRVEEYTKQADIIVSATGSPHLIGPSMIKNGAILFDMGFSLVDHKVVGDVDFEKVKTKCKYITRNPGGVGPVTVALLLTNIYRLAKKRKNEKYI